MNNWYLRLSLWFKKGCKKVGSGVQYCILKFEASVGPGAKWQKEEKRNYFNIFSLIKHSFQKSSGLSRLWGSLRVFQLRNQAKKKLFYRTENWRIWCVMRKMKNFTNQWMEGIQETGISNGENLVKTKKATKPPFHFLLWQYYYYWCKAVLIRLELK